MSDLSTVHDIDEAVTQRIGDGTNFWSIVDGEPFRATFNQPKDIVMVFLPGRSTKGTTVRPTERIALWRDWMAKKSFTPGDYSDVSKSAEFLLSVLADLAPEDAAAHKAAVAAEAAKAKAAEEPGEDAAEGAAEDAAEEPAEEGAEPPAEDAAEEAAEPPAEEAAEEAVAADSAGDEAGEAAEEPVKASGEQE